MPSGHVDTRLIVSKLDNVFLSGQFLIWMDTGGVDVDGGGVGGG